MPFVFPASSWWPAAGLASTPTHREITVIDRRIHDDKVKNSVVLISDNRYYNDMKYSVLIRTYNSGKTLPETLYYIYCQSVQPEQYIIIDSGSTDNTKEKIPENSKFINYKYDKFNYSLSLNQGVQYVETDYVLIVSSHTILENANAVQFAMNLLEAREDIGAAYFTQELSDDLSFQEIGPHNFTGFNGLWNTCAFVRTSLLKKRGFRPEVFSAEDQEWTRWLLSSERRLVARISGGGMRYDNPLKDRRLKRLREQVAVALYAKPEMLRLPYLARVFYRVIRPVSSFSERIANARLLKALIYCRMKKQPPPHVAPPYVAPPHVGPPHVGQ